MSEYRGTNQLFRVPSSGGDVTQLTSGRYNWGLLDLFPDGKHALVSFMDMARPRELAVMNLEDGTTETITEPETSCGIRFPMSATNGFNAMRNGYLTIRVVGGQQSYTGSDRNGIATSDYGPWGASFLFVRK